MNLNFRLFPEAASSFAGQIDALYIFLCAVTVFFVVAIFAIVVYFAVRYRRKSADEVPDPVEGNTLLEITWSVIPLIIVMIMFAWGTRVFLVVRRPPANATPVYVVGKQWMWKIQHPNGRSEINELHVPVGQPIRLTMTSEDVIHSFFVPAFRVKMDVVPGRYSSAWFEATQEGSYQLLCAEYCGTSHSKMRGKVIALSQAEYQEWLDEVPASGAPAAGGEALTMADMGAAVFEQFKCGTCHMEKSGALGPSLHGIYNHEIELVDGSMVVADDAYLRESILNSQASLVKGYGPVMPPYAGQIDEQQILLLIEYIKSLSGSDEAHGE